MAVEVVDGGLVLSALLVIVILSLLTYIFSHHPKHLTNNNMPLQVVNQDKLDLNLPENPSTGSTSTSETLTSLVEADQSEAVGGEAQDNHLVNQDKIDLNLLEKLKIIMPLINKMIDYAEEKVTTDSSVKPFLYKLKDAVYDAEDLVDVIATQTLWNPFDRSLQEELEDVFGKMQFLLEQQDVFGLKPSTRSNSPSETSMRLATTSLVEQDVHGRDDDKDKIKKLLLSNDGKSNRDVIAIVGMGGLGKTTLARLVFNDYEINSVFKSNKVWICVAEDFDVKKITKTILEKLTEKPYDTNDLDLLQTKLHETLSGKKFLIVLDDVWNENYMKWDQLRRPFGFAAQGSKILVTTRSEKVASVMHATSTYKLKPLPDDACWSVFSKHAFEDIQSNVNSTFEADVVKKCRGLPLAAKVLGGLLHGSGREKWNEILRSNIWNLSDDVRDDILPVLRLSYHYLPSHLKRCFALCSLVPKDCDFQREKLVLLWMAENLLQDSKSKRRIDVGYEYLHDLELRLLIQPSSDGEKLYFGMHDLVNDLANSVSGEFYENFDFGNSFNLGEKTRHFSYAVARDDQVDPARFKEINEAKRLRTFLPLLLKWSNVMVPPLLRSEIWPQLKLLRSLTLAKAGIITLSDFIGNLKLLRYLDLSRNDKIIQLPESVASLYNLEVLNLSYCRSLTKLPSKMRQLIKLNYLNIRYTKLQEMPLQMGSLKDLDVLTDFVVGNGSGSSIKELKELKYIRGDLSLRGLQNIPHPEDALEANLKEKSRIEELYLTWEDSDSDNSKEKSHLEELMLEGGTTDSDNSEDARIILENLKPPVNLKKLCIKKYNGTRLPEWLGHYSSFVNLVDVAVIGFKHCIDLSPLGQLPSLKSLDIQKCESLVRLIPVEIHHVRHFSALVSLKIFCCPKLELPQHLCFTLIEDLSIERSCASLQLFPLSSFPKLKTLYLKDLGLESIVAVIDEENNFNLEYMETIEIKDCPNLKIFDFPLSLFPKLKKLNLRNLKSIESLAVIDEANDINLEYLEYIKIRNCQKLEIFGFTLSSFPKLKSLHLGDLQSIESLANNINLEYLEAIEIENCSNLEYVNAGNWYAPKMAYLNLKKCESLKVLPENMCNLFPSLLELHLNHCPNLEALPQSGLPSSLRGLKINGCKKLIANCSRWGLQRLLSLSSFEIGNYECDDLESFPEEGLLPSSLSTLKIENVPNLTNLNGRSIQLLTCLKTLQLRYCPKLQYLESLSQSGLPSSLRYLEIKGCKKLIANRSRWGLQRLLSLSSFEIGSYECDDLESFPEEGLLPSSLSELYIEDVPNLRSLNGNSIQLLTSLNTLLLSKCPKLRCLPEEGLPSSLSTLELSKCPLLESRCQREQGEDWSKIADIPEIYIY